MATKKIKIPKELIKEKKFDDRVKLDKKKRQELYNNKTWYTIRALLGHHDVN